MKKPKTTAPGRASRASRSAKGSPLGLRTSRVTRQPRGQGRADVDGPGPSAVDTAAVTLPEGIPSGSPVGLVSLQTMEKEHFGICLRRARESSDLSLADVAQKTKVARSTLDLLEKGDLDLLPTGVYARGFIRSFARAVGLDETEPLLLFERALEARSATAKAVSTTPVLDASEVFGYAAEDESMAPRRGLGLAVFVIILLLIATITLSLLLRRPPPSGEGLSLLPASPAVVLSNSSATG